MSPKTTRRTPLRNSIPRSTQPPAQQWESVTEFAGVEQAPTTATESDETVKRATYSGICPSCGSYIVVGQTHGCLR
jgi:hypothetical protein